jgi:hypothetical protein
VANGSVWEINREIVLTFSDPIDFSTVSSNTINVRSSDDVPATGIFRLRDAKTVAFQPTCPRLDDYSDAGLLPDSTYDLRIAGLNTSSNTLRSVDGAPLAFQQVRRFTTPSAASPLITFQDTLLGPPLPVLRAQGSSDRDASYLEVGGDPDERVYFELDANRQPVLSDPSFQAELNLYSDAASRVSVVLFFDQPVNPSSGNISATRLRIEYLDSAGVWTPIGTRVTLTENCTETGATVRLDPVGVFPPAKAIRAVIRAGFQDLVGDALGSSMTTFAVIPTRTTDFASLTPSDLLSDEINESFDFGGDSPLSFQDTGALFDSPEAEWGQGKLAAAFSFEGTGGPNGNFDWVVRSGESFNFDTSSQLITGGPNGTPVATLNAVKGVVDVRNFRIEAGGEVRVQGPNPMRINATGEVRIDGVLSLAGFNARNVSTLNTGNQVERGAAGTAGGGKGGDGNLNTAGPTPRGGRGDGPFLQSSLGGDGGEMGVNPTTTQKNGRRPGGGGGGRFSKDWVGTSTSAGSVAATAGRPGNASSRGAESGLRPAAPGAPGSGPFLDLRDDNDFFGVRPVVQGGNLVGLVRGELPSLWAGYGGGAGGNAGTQFPNNRWTFASDEKGGGGGGGGGGLHVKALGRIVFGPQGVISTAGGLGAAGENTNFLDHIGGTGGGGSGGHIVLESASLVDFTDGGSVTQTTREWLFATGPTINTGPQQYVDDCCLNDSNGGAGGGGVIQIHVPEPTRPPSSDPLTSDILLPPDSLGVANPLDRVASPPALAMIPTFGARSKVRSKWISIGGADQGAAGSRPVRFLFEGTDAAGKIETNGATVLDQPPLLDVPDLANSSTVRVLADGFTVEMTGASLQAIRGGQTAGLSNDIYLRTPALLHDCAVRLLTSPTNFEDFAIVHASYSEGLPAAGDELLTIRVTTERGPLTAFGGPGTEGLQLRPRFFGVVTNGLSASLPSTAFVRILFQAARDNGSGQPDAVPLVDWTADISQFNQTPLGALQFFRYEVEFNLDADAQGVTRDTAPVELEFLKIPFVF